MEMMANRGQEWLNNNRGGLDDLLNNNRGGLDDLLNRGREFLNNNKDNVPDWMKNIEEQFGPMPSWMEQVITIETFLLCKASVDKNAIGKLAFFYLCISYLE